MYVSTGTESHARQDAVRAARGEPVVKVSQMVSVLRRVPAGLLILCVITCATVPAWAQDAPAAPAADPAADPAAQPPKVASPLVTEPQTPEELFAAVVLMVELARPEVAKLYLTKFMESDPPDDLLLALREKHGPAVFLKLSNIEDLQPLSIELLKRNNDAFNRFARDPARLDALLKNLVTGTSSQRITAQDQMRTAGVHVVPALISALGNPAYAESQNVFVETLALIKSEAVAPLEAALVSPNNRIRQSAMQALGVIGDPTAIPHLLRYAGQAEPSEDKAAASKAIAKILKMPSIASAESSGVATKLLQRARDHFLGKIEYEIGTDKLVSIWEWSDQRGTVHERRVTPAEKSLYEGLYFANAAIEVAPEREDVQVTYLNILLSQEAALTGVGKPLTIGPGTVHDLAESLGPDVVSRALGEALELHRTDAALAALQVLAKIGTVQQVRTVGGKQAVLQRALNSPSRRVQFAAVQTILALDPSTRYPGSDRVVAVLGRALTQAEASQPRGLVLDSVTERGQTLAGFLREMGYESSLVRTGTEGFKTAAVAQEVDLVLVDANIQRWALSETLANFKADPRTMDLPIVIYGSSQNERNVRIHVQQHRNVIFIQEPTAADDLREQMARFLAGQAEPPLSPEERSAKAITATNLLALMSSGQRQNLYNLTPIEPQLLTAVENAQLAIPLLPVVGSLPTAAAQIRIANLATDSGISNEIRTAAVRQLAQHVRRHGLLISKDQVDALHKLWAESANAPISSELSALMGLLKPNATLIGERLRSVTVNQAPAPEPAQP